MSEAILVDKHPLDDIIRADRMPHIWCSGCGIGIAMRCYAEAMLKHEVPLDKHVVVSGIGCSGRVAGYLNIDSYHTTHGRAIPFAIGLKLANPELQVTVFSGDGDLAAIGRPDRTLGARLALLPGGDLGIAAAIGVDRAHVGHAAGHTLEHQAAAVG